jgi:lipoate-protein ligase A
MNWNLQSDLPGASAEADIAAEMALLEAAFVQPILRIWQTHQCLVVTPLIGQRTEFNPAATASQARGWPVILRRTGGGPVPLTTGTLSISMAYSADRAESHSIDRAFQMLADPLCATFGKLGLAQEVGEVPGSCCPGRYDIAIDGKKLVGIAQRRRQGQRDGTMLTAILVHAMVWIEPGLEAGIDALETFLQATGVPARFAREKMGTLREISGKLQSAAEFAALFEETVRGNLTSPSPDSGEGRGGGP